MVALAIGLATILNAVTTKHAQINSARIPSDAGRVALASGLKTKRTLTAVLVGGLVLSSVSLTVAAALPADLVLQNARIYTEDTNRSTAEALAVRDGKIVYVGAGSRAKALIGPKTQVEDGGGRLVLPG